MGVTLATFRGLGKIPLEKQWFMRTERMFERAGAPSLKNFAGILSGPAALFEEKDSIIFKISNGSVGFKKNDSGFLSLKNSWIHFPTLLFILCAFTFSRWIS